jgi:hypothetical protein
LSVKSATLPITSSQITHLWQGLRTAYWALGFESVTKGDNVFRDPVLARTIAPTSKVDEGRVLNEVGVEPASYATPKRRLPPYAQLLYRGRALSNTPVRASLFILQRPA